MNKDLQHIIIIEIINSIAIYYVHKLLNKTNVLPNNNENDSDE